MGGKITKMGFSTKSWVIGILVGSLIATFVVGYLHSAELLSEPANPILHALKDWIIVLIPLLPVSYILARIIK